VSFFLDGWVHPRIKRNATTPLSINVAVNRIGWYGMNSERQNGTFMKTWTEIDKLYDPSIISNYQRLYGRSLFYSSYLASKSLKDGKNTLLVQEAVETMMM
jgi:hypothetical protein